MAWKFPNSLRRVFTRSTSHQLNFTTKFQEAKNLDQWKIIRLAITKTKVKQKLGLLHAIDNIDHQSNQGEY